MTLCFGGLFLLVLAGLSFFARDMMWDLTQWQNSMKGIASERTEGWELMTSIGGVICAILGVVALFAFFTGG
ncbi:MAG: hypothetical protein JNM55_07545 [Anaerolineales bacterium]|nr:hypothetical protein [Anaerolineales bacterium]